MCKKKKKKKKHLREGGIFFLNTFEVRKVYVAPLKVL